jgi:HSP20 family protein
LSDPWWRRRKKKNPWVNDLYEELERLGAMIDETMQKAFENSSENSTIKNNKFQGFSIKVGPDGKPRIKEVSKKQIQYDKEINFNSEPLVDIIEERGWLVVLVTLPGVTKNDIDLRIKENCLTVNVDADDFEWYQELDLPRKVKTKSASASYKNGVLKVRLEKLEKLINKNKIPIEK